jgi:hypothetical protein
VIHLDYVKSPNFFWGEIIIYGPFLGTFRFTVTRCIIYFPLKGCAFNVGFHFWCLGLIILTFKNILLGDIPFEKINLFNHLNSMNHGYIFSSKILK